MLEAERRARILAALLGVPPMTLDELVSVSGIEKGLAFDTVRFLKDEGYVDAIQATTMGGVNFIEIKLVPRGRALVENH